MRVKHILMFAAFSCASAVLMGAFAAHALKGLLEVKALAWIDTAVQYQFYHSLGLFVVACLSISVASPLLRYSAYCFILGIVLFSGSLYALAFSSFSFVVYLTPLGGLSFVLGWLLLIFAVRHFEPSSKG